MWSHPGRGTCIPGCPLWGRCHCGCGSRTSLAAQSRLNGRGEAVRGRPLVWVHGHAARLLRGGRTQRVSPPLARRIVDLVLASRRPLDPVATFELDEPRRLATVRERRVAPSPHPSRRARVPAPARKVS